MTYDEFLEIVKCDTDDITFKTYSEIIEPMYMSIDLDKREFCSLLNIKNLINMTENVTKYAKKIIQYYKSISDNERYNEYLENADDVIEAVANFGTVKGGEGRIQTYKQFIEKAEFEVNYHVKNKLSRVEVYKIVKNKIVLDHVFTF